MTGREQERRRRRTEPAGGSPSRRTDRIRRPAERLASILSDQPDTEDGTDTSSEYDAARRAARGRGGVRPGRRPLINRALGPVLGRLSTRRAALLALVVCGLALSIAVPLHTYLSQRDDLAAQQQQQQVLREQRKELRKREQQLSDPAQIEAEARTRLHFVLPGETPYVVQLPSTAPTPATGRGAKKPDPTTSWYEALWNSIAGTP
ncbi:MAG TPA: septum formation initiator family protein [Pseudonocardiaceae bacterium]|nr:septum formation initiator family protein [Pseudonocardiaceae bacterium]